MERESFNLAGVRAVRRRMSGVLAAWSVGSVLAGAAAWAAAQGRDAPVRQLLEAVAAQFVIWGAIDLLFAVIGLRQTWRSVGTDDDAEQLDTSKLVRILRFNNRLNVVWLAVGAVLLASGLAAAVRRVGSEAGAASLIGHGVGVLVQGGFLALFDRAFLRRVLLHGGR